MPLPYRLHRTFLYTTLRGAAKKRRPTATWLLLLHPRCAALHPGPPVSLLLSTLPPRYAKNRG